MHSYRIHLRRADIDAFGHVNNVALVQYLDEARDALLAAGPAVEQRPWRVVVAAHEITFQRPLVLEQRAVDVVTTTNRINRTNQPSRLTTLLTMAGRRWPDTRNGVPGQ